MSPKKGAPPIVRNQSYTKTRGNKPQRKPKAKPRSPNKHEVGGQFAQTQESKSHGHESNRGAGANSHNQTEVNPCAQELDSLYCFRALCLTMTMQVAAISESPGGQNQELHLLMTLQWAMVGEPPGERSQEKNTNTTYTQNIRLP